MLNKNGNTENLKEFHENGEVSYKFFKDLYDYSYEYTYDENGNELTYKNSNNYSHECAYDENGKELTFKNSNGYSYEYTRDENGKELTYRNSNGYSYEYTRDENGNELTYKNSKGVKRGFKEEGQTGDQPQEEKAKAEPNAILISRELANGLFKYFTEKPHLIEEIEHFVNGLRSGIPVNYTPEEPKS